MLQKDVFREILLKFNDENLIKTCGLNRYFYNNICDDGFFHSRLLQKYSDTLKNKPKDMKYKAWYLRIGFYVIKLKQLFKYDYVRGNPKVQIEIFKDGKSKNRLFLQSALNGELTLVKYFAEQGADIQTKNDLALQRASGKGYLDIVKYLVENGANIHAYNNKALEWASRAGHLKVVKYLVEKGVDINAFTDEALKSAKQKGHIEIVKYLEATK
jgi:hypothetical protein